MTPNVKSALGNLETVAATRVKFLESQIEAAIAAHKWWFAGGLIAGALITAALERIL
jgi:hypothetical protein